MAIICILFAKDITKVRLFISSNEKIHKQNDHEQIPDDGQRVKKERPRNDQAKYAQVHGISDIAIEAADDENFGRINGRWRAHSFHRKIPGAPKVNCAAK